MDNATYGNEKVRQIAEQSGILLIPPINRRNSEERKDAYGLVLPVFLKTRFGQRLFALLREIEQNLMSKRVTGWNIQDGTYFIVCTACVILHSYA